MFRRTRSPWSLVDKSGVELVFELLATSNEELSPYDPRKKKGSFFRKYKESHTPKVQRIPNIDHEKMYHGLLQVHSREQSFFSLLQCACQQSSRT